VTVRRVVLTAALLVTALVLQVVVVARWHLPGGGPFLLLLVVVSLAAVWGPMPGMGVGFAAGLLLDTAPPAAGPMGLWAAVLCLTGYAAGLVWVDRRRPVWVWLVLVAATSAGAVLVYAVVSALVGDPRVAQANVPGLVMGTVLYDLLLTPFVVPGVAALARRTDPAPSLP
jgi:rod shape-determining protein MreD